MHNFRNLIIWQKSKELVKDIYKLTSEFSKEEKFGIISQIQRSCISISSNIAEGSGRNSKKDFNRFLEIAISSSFELESLMVLSFDLSYCSNEKYEDIINKIKEIQKMIYGFKNKLIK